MHRVFFSNLKTPCRCVRKYRVRAISRASDENERPLLYYSEGWSLKHASRSHPFPTRFRRLNDVLVSRVLPYFRVSYKVRLRHVSSDTRVVYEVESGLPWRCKLYVYTLTKMSIFERAIFELFLFTYRARKTTIYYTHPEPRYENMF